MLPLSYINTQESLMRSPKTGLANGQFADPNSTCEFDTD